MADLLIVLLLCSIGIPAKRRSNQKQILSHINKEIHINNIFKVNQSLKRNRNCLPIASTWPGFTLVSGVLVVHLVSALCCGLVLFVLWSKVPVSRDLPFLIATLRWHPVEEIHCWDDLFLYTQGILFEHYIVT